MNLTFSQINFIEYEPVKYDEGISNTKAQLYCLNVCR